VAILDTFYTLFKTNSEEVRKGFQDAEKATDKFSESVKHADEGVNVAGQKIIETFTEIGAAIAAAFAFERVKEFIESTIEINAHLQQTSERIGVAVEDLAALQSAATRFGGSADGVTGSLDFLNRGLADIAVKGTSRLKPFFDELKINVLTGKGHVKDLVTVLGELADKMHGKSAQERAGLGERFALDPGLLLAMADGRRGLEDLIKRQKELGVTTAEDAEQAEKFSQKMEDLKTVFHHVGNEIVGGLLPLFGRMVDGVMAFAGFLEKHKPLVEGFFIGVGGIIAAEFLPAIIDAIIATAAFLAEWLLVPALIVAAGVAFGLLYDDIKNFLSGNKSVIGELTKKWPIIGEVVREVAKDVGAIFKWLGEYAEAWGSMWKATINLVVAIFTAFGRVASNMGREIYNAWATSFPGAAKLIGGVSDAIAGLIKWIEKAIGWFVKFGASAVAAFPKALGNLAGWMNSAAVSINGPQLATGGTAPSLAARTAANDRRIADMFAPHPARTIAAGKGYAQPHPAQTVAAIKAGKAQVAAATATHLSSVTNSAISHGSQTTTKKIEVKTGDITINTQAKDGKEVAGALGDHLAEHVRKAIAQHDDGVAS
jgi:hypothetical protein